MSWTESRMAAKHGIELREQLVREPPDFFIRWKWHVLLSKQNDDWGWRLPQRQRHALLIFA